ncbi:MAG: PepSY-associated TM helix domain-containing protein [Pseudomonadota bacterium]
MNMKRMIRDVHHWASIVVALPLIVMIGAGLLLMVKKEIDWIQPPTQKGSVIAVQSIGADAGSLQSLDELVEAARTARPESFTDWGDLERIDIKPKKGVAKIISKDRWEVQVDLVSGTVLQTAYRRSDLIESIHDGSFFAKGAKLWIFLPAGLVLFGLWLTGLYLFFLPHYKLWQKRRLNAARAD